MSIPSVSCAFWVPAVFLVELIKACNKLVKENIKKIQIHMKVPYSFQNSKEGITAENRVWISIWTILNCTICMLV